MDAVNLKGSFERQANSDIDLLSLPEADQERIIEVWRTANIAHASAHSAVAGHLTAWIFAILVTINLGGLALAITESGQLQFPSLVKGALLTGIISTLVAGIAAMDNYNCAANRARLMSVATKETIVAQTLAASNLGRRQVKSDKVAVAFLALSLISLIAAGILGF